MAQILHCLTFYFLLLLFLPEKSNILSWYIKDVLEDSLEHRESHIMDHLNGSITGDHVIHKLFKFQPRWIPFKPTQRSRVIRRRERIHGAVELPWTWWGLEFPKIRKIGQEGYIHVHSMFDLKNLQRLHGFRRFRQLKSHYRTLWEDWWRHPQINEHIMGRMDLEDLPRPVYTSSEEAWIWRDPVTWDRADGIIRKDIYEFAWAKYFNERNFYATKLKK